MVHAIKFTNEITDNFTRLLINHVSDFTTHTTVLKELYILTCSRYPLEGHIFCVQEAQVLHKQENHTE